MHCVRLPEGSAGGLLKNFPDPLSAAPAGELTGEPARGAPNAYFLYIFISCVYRGASDTWLKINLPL
jgi:hypothetical protein